jgi:hypothetical protein
MILFFAFLVETLPYPIISVSAADDVIDATVKIDPFWPAHE